MKTTEEILFEFTKSNLQVHRLNREIEKLIALRDVANANAVEAFNLYHDRIKQEGKEIDLPNLADSVDQSLLGL
jgi:hypothetical protein